MDRLDAIATFVAVADLGTFVGAARRLGRSPAAVTRAVAGLEAHLGVRLFHRTTRAVALSDAGRRHLESARRLLADVAAMDSTASADRSEPAGLLTVASSVVFGRLHVQPLVTAFLRRHPAAQVRLELSDRLASLVDEGIDVAIRLGPLRDSTVKAIRIGSVRRALYASPSYLAATVEPTTPADLAKQTCIAFTGVTAHPARWTFGAGATRSTVAVAPRLVTNLADAAIDAAVGGFGVTCVLSYMVDHLVATGALRPLLVEFEPPPIPIHVLHAGGRQPSAGTRAFVDATVAALRSKFGAVRPR